MEVEAAGERSLPWRSGIGRDLQALEDCTVSLITERRASQPLGLQAAAPARWGRAGSCSAAARQGPSACLASARCDCRRATLYR